MGIFEKVKSNVVLYAKYVFGCCIGAATPKYMSSEANDSQSTGSRSSSLSIKTNQRTEGEILQSPNLKSFTLTELKEATGDFRQNSVLGEGGFGRVFKGWIDEHTLTPSKPGTGMAIAVKRLNHNGGQGHHEWLAEVNYLGHFSHPNLVKLIGYCLEDEHRLLVYEFMPRGSLENHLFRRGSYFKPLSWELRLKVVLDAAKCLAFLHNTETSVIYRDFKTSNILLDSDFNAKLSDFGLAKDGPTNGESHVSTRIMGTNGYIAPEYHTSGHLTTRCDVYSYGVVLLEVLSGLRAVDCNRPQQEQRLVDLAGTNLAKERNLYRFIDKSLQDPSIKEEATKVAALAMSCLQKDPTLRPGMNEVVSYLKQIPSLNKAGGRYVDKNKKKKNRRSNNVATNQKPNAGIARQPTAYPRPSDSPLFV